MVEPIQISHRWLYREQSLTCSIETEIMIQSIWISNCLTLSIFLSLVYGAVIEDKSQRALSIFNIIKVLTLKCGNFW